MHSNPGATLKIPVFTYYLFIIKCCCAWNKGKVNYTSFNYEQDEVKNELDFL